MHIGSIIERFVDMSSVNPELSLHQIYYNLLVNIQQSLNSDCSFESTEWLVQISTKRYQLLEVLRISMKQEIAEWS